MANLLKTEHALDWGQTAQEIEDQYQTGMIERDLYRAALDRCASAAGNPDPSTGCRLVIYYVKEVTE